ncbi:MAG TPA: AlpA family transcriptional regulator [Dokdonella sp.]
MPEVETRLIRLPEVLRLTGLGKSQVYALAKAGKFPTPIKLSERCSAFEESEIRAWIAERIAERNAKAAAA